MTVGLIIIFFLVIGLIFLLVEILVTPGVVLGIIGLGFIAYGIVQTYKEFGSQTGNIALLTMSVITIGIVLMALKSGVWTRMASKGTIASKALEDIGTFAQAGDKGKALSAMRPLGTALLGGKKLEVRTEGEIIDAGSEIEVIRVEGNKIFIKKI